MEEAPLKFTKHLSDQKVKDKDAVVMECEVTKPGVQVLWLKGVQELKPDNRVRIFNDQCLHKLLIFTVSVDDEGIYTCVCGEERSECQVTVEEAPVKFTKHLSNQKVKDKDAVVMECEVTKPNVHVLWLKDGQKLKPDNRVEIFNDQCLHKLLILPVSMDDEGIYTCVCGEERSECQVTVEEAPVKFTKSLSNQKVKDKDAVVMECEVTKPNVQVFWLKGGQKLKPDNRIVIFNDQCLHKLLIATVSMDDEGIYSCVCGDEKTECKIAVEEAPVKFTKPLSNQKVKDKDAVVMECEVTKPNVQVLWLKGGQELKPDNRTVIFNDQCLHKLLIATVSMDDEGIYSCVCGDEKTECKIAVEEIPAKFSKFLMNQEVKEKETLVMECHLTKPNVKVCWLKGGQEVILSNDRIEVSNDHCLHRLVITDVTMKDEGVYTCVCGEERTECQITVEEIPAKFSKFLMNQEVKEKETLVMECHLTKPNVKVCWLKGGQEVILSNDRIEVSNDHCLHRLVITDVTMKDEGVYTCVCGEERTECQITVEEIPAKFSKFLMNQEVKEKETLVMECHLTKPNVKVCWLKGGQEVILSNDRIEVSNDHCLHRLVITDVTMKDEGVYTCVCGEERTECQITVEVSSVSSELLNSPELIKLYNDALRDGQEKEYQIRVMVVGCYSQGKTSLTRRLLEQPVDDVASTNGVDVHETTCDILKDGKWKSLDDSKLKEEQVKRLVHVASEHSEDNKNSANDNTTNVLRMRDSGHKQMLEPDVEDELENLDYNVQMLSPTKNDFENTDTKKNSYDDDNGDDNEMLAECKIEEEFSGLSIKEDGIINIKQLPNSEHQNEVTSNTVLYMSFAHQYTGNKDSNKNCQISVWDFGGQSVFYSTHQLFLSREAVYLLVFDLSRSLDDVIEDVDTGQMKSMKDYLKFWVTSIHCFVGKMHPSNNGDHFWLPWIFLVGTHKKDLDKDKIKKYFNEVRTLFKKSDLKFHLHEKDFSVDNKDYSDAGLEDFRVLKEAIWEKAVEQIKVALPIPAKWIALEIKLLQRNDGIISFKDVLEINRYMNCPLPDDYVKKFLVYCHEKGRLLYFENAKHVVLKPQYLIDAFKVIITSSDHCLRTPALSAWWDKLYNEAKLYPKLIDGLWRNKFMDHKDIILQFLEKHYVICKVVDPCETFFLVPSFLKPAKQEVLEEFMFGKSRSKIALVFQFKYLTLVPTIFQRATAAILSNWVPYKYKTQYLVFENFIGCQMNEGHVGTLRMKENSLELVIVKLPHNGDSFLVQTSDAFRRFVTKCVKNEFQMATRVTHENSFYKKYRCMDPKHKSTGSIKTIDLVIDIDNQSKLVSCPDDEHQISLSSALAEWFRPQPNPKELSNIVLTLDDINTISENIYEIFDENSILELDRQLNTTLNMNGQHIKSMIYEMLLQWREKELSAGHNAKLDDLLQAINKISKDKDGSMLNDAVRNFLDDKGYSRSATDSVADTKRNVSFKEVLIKAHTELVCAIDPAPLLDHFIENKFISPQKARDIAELKNTSEKNRAILERVQNNTEDGYQLFKTCLRKSNQEDLVFKLTETETILSQEQEQPRDSVIPPAADVDIVTDIEEIDIESERVFSVVTDVDEIQGDSSNDIDISLREYQKELAQEGFQGYNVIIVAPTNTGKTRVASRIIQEHFRSRRKKNLFCCVIFLVENESLAQQQGQVLAELLPIYRTKVISGSIKQAKKQHLKDFIIKRDILVVTAQILLNCLKLKEIDSLTKFSMLVFDECHHTDNEHRYNEVMRFYMDLKLRLNVAASDLPQIIGLTASLGTGGYTDENKATNHMKKLLANMDIKFLCMVQENKEELKRFENNPIERIVTAKIRVNNRYRDAILGIAAKINNYIASHPSMKKLEECDEFICVKSKVPDNLGSQQFLSWLSDLKDSIGKVTSKELGRMINPCMLHLEIYNKALTIHNDARIKDAETILKDFMQSLAKETSHETDRMLRSFYDGLNNVSFEDEPENPKLLKMQEILLQVLGNNNNGRGIIFVKSRELAKALVAWMQETPALAKLNATEFVGQRAPVASGGMTKRNQKDALFYFKDGKHKILVATSVAEEGLDITKCNLVIRYEHVTNEIVRLQSRGRARAQESHYFVLTSEGSWIADKEEKNAFLEQIMSRIVPYLQVYMKHYPNEWDNERRQIQDYQKQAEERMSVQKKGSIVNDCVEFQCFNCRQFLCRSSDVRVIQGVHHVCINRDIDKYIRKHRKPNPKFAQNDLQFDGSIICANNNCTKSYNLGSMCEYKHAEYPLIKITQIRILYANGEGRHFKKWKDVNFEMAPFNMNDVANV